MREPTTRRVGGGGTTRRVGVSSEGRTTGRVGGGGEEVQLKSAP